MYTRTSLPLLLIYLLSSAQASFALTQNEIEQHKQQFIDMLLQDIDLLAQPSPRIYSAQALTVLSEGRFVAFNPSQNRALLKPSAYTELSTTAEPRGIQYQKRSNAPAKFVTPDSFQQDVRSSGPELPISSQHNKPWYQNYQVEILPDTAEHAPYHDCDNERPICKATRVTQTTMQKQSAKSPQVHHAIMSINNAQRDQRTCAAVTRAAQSYAHRARLLHQIEHSSDIEIVNHLLGTNFNHGSLQADFEDCIFDHAQALLQRYDLYSSVRYHDFLYTNVPILISYVKAQSK